MKLPFYAKLILTVLVVLAVSEFAPKVTNAFLVLVLIGIMLTQWSAFANLAEQIGITAK